MKKSFFSNDWVLKIISFIGAVLLWMYIIVVVDPPVDITIRDIPIQYIEQGKLASQGLSVVSDKEQTMELKIRGSRKKLVDVDSNAISAIVDLSTVTSVGTHSLPVNIVIPYEYTEIVSRKPYSLDVTIDKIVEVRKEIKVKAAGNTENNYMAGEIKVTPSSVLLKGAESVIAQVSEIIVPLDYNYSADDIYAKNQIEFLDEDGNTLPQDSEIMQLIISDVDTVDVFCPIYQLKTVAVNPNYSGEPLPLEDGTNTEIQVIPGAVTLYGKADALKDIKEIETESFSVSGLGIGDELTVNLKKPEDIAGICDDISTVTVRVIEDETNND